MSTACDRSAQTFFCQRGRPMVDGAWVTGDLPIGGCSDSLNLMFLRGIDLGGIILVEPAGFGAAQST